MSYLYFWFLNSVETLYKRSIQLKKMKKYNSFFEELIEIHLKVKLWRNSKVKEATEIEILNFENEIGKLFGEGMKSYLKYFGKGPQTHGGIYKYSFACMREAKTEIEEMDIFKEQRQIILKSNKEKTIPITKVCFANYIDYNGCFTLMLQEEENPSLYFGEAYEDKFDLLSERLTNSIRNEIVHWIRHLISIRFDKSGKTDFKKLNSHTYEMAQRADFGSLNWAKYYIDNQRKRTYNERKEFEKIITKEENKENKIIGFNEFEERFIEYLEK